MKRKSFLTVECAPLLKDTLVTKLCTKESFLQVKADPQLGVELDCGISFVLTAMSFPENIPPLS